MHDECVVRPEPRRRVLAEGVKEKGRGIRWFLRRSLPPLAQHRRRRRYAILATILGVKLRDDELLEQQSGHPRLGHVHCIGDERNDVLIWTNVTPPVLSRRAATRPPRDTRRWLMLRELLPNLSHHRCVILKRLPRIRRVHALSREPTVIPVVDASERCDPPISSRMDMRSVNRKALLMDNTRFGERRERAPEAVRPCEQPLRCSSEEQRSDTKHYARCFEQYVDSL